MSIRQDVLEHAAALKQGPDEWSRWGQGYRICPDFITNFSRMTFLPGGTDPILHGALLGFLPAMRPRLPVIEALGHGSIVAYDRLAFPEPLEPMDCIRLQERCDETEVTDDGLILTMDHRMQIARSQAWALTARIRWRYPF